VRAATSSLSSSSASGAVGPAIEGLLGSDFGNRDSD